MADVMKRPDLIGRCGPLNYAWKGDNVTYTAVHYRLYAQRGKASEYPCACGQQAVLWAFDEPTGFSTDLSRYSPMCATCHRNQFAEAITHCPYGHEYDEANTYITPRGSRVCRACRRVATARPERSQ